ncbi:MAG TPA: 23S rRNA (uracil(1939)-C(5))-methyltransferase RlmD [bacterium]|nr:23S rRNA (uracil(1939)-C(5))-methyltransferase RlmD [bacterium]
MIVRFSRMGAGGEALATVAGREVAVPYAAPGEEAVIRVLRVERGRAEGRLVALRIASPKVVSPRCPHFGRCGGCQWQHLEYSAQLEQKTALIQEALRQGHLSDRPVSDAVGWGPPWEFRTHLEATVGARDGRRVLGFFSWGGDRVVEVGQCPVQHPSNVAAMNAVRTAWEALRPVAGILRGLISRVGAASGEVMLGLSVMRPLSVAERGVVVRTLLDAVPQLVSLMEVRAPRRGHLLAGRRADLLWGRPYVEDDVAGVRFHVPLVAEFPVNRHAVPGLIELILGALDASSADTVLEPDAGIGGYTLHLALAAGRVVAVTTADQLDAAWDNARLNQITNCRFYTRNPVRALEKIAKREPIRLAFLHPPGTGLAPDLPPALRRAGIQRVAYLGRALGALANDAVTLEREGFRIRRVQPVDLSPQTSRVHALISASMV